jgi:hypothetical protein
LLHLNLLLFDVMSQPGALRPNRTSDSDFFCLGNFSDPVMQCYKLVLEGTSPHGARWYPQEKVERGHLSKGQLDATLFFQSQVLMMRRFLGFTLSLLRPFLRSYSQVL